MKRKNKKNLTRAAMTLLTLLLTTTTAWALTPRNDNHTWDETTKTLTLNSLVGSYSYENETEIEHLVINPGAEWLDRSSFRGCSNLKDVTFAENANLTFINGFAFEDCTSLTTITIPASVTYIGRGAFKNTGWYNSQADGPLYLDNWLLGYKGNMSADYELSIADGTKRIAEYAFYDFKTLSEVNIPASVTTIWEGAFDSCVKLESITFASDSKLEVIGESAFKSCSALKSITIPASVTAIGEGAFYGCSNLATVSFADVSALPTIGEDAFKETACIDEEGVLYFGNIAFKYYGYDDAADVTIKDGTVTIYDYCFYNNSSLKSVTIPASVTTIGEGAFDSCEALESITIPASVTSIGDDAFDSCEKLESITFASGSKLEVIGDDAFECCSALKSITIPASVTSIGSYSFYYCTSLQAINVDEGNENYTSEDGVLFDKAKTTLMQYPAGKSVAPYIVPASVTTIGYGAFDSCEKLESITFASGSMLEVIGDWSFEYCEALKSITIPASVTTIGEGAFDSCEALESVTFASGSMLEVIGDWSFEFCEALESITIPASVTTIGEGAFDECTSTTDVYCYADPAKLTWESYTSDFNENTKFHVNDNQLAAYVAKFGDAQVKFVGEAPKTYIITVSVPGMEPFTSGVKALPFTKPFRECVPTDFANLMNFASIKDITIVGDNVEYEEPPYSWDTEFTVTGPGTSTVTVITTMAPVTLTVSTTRAFEVAANNANGAYWATFYSSEGNFQAADGTQVFAVNLDGTTLTMNEISGGIVNQEQGVVLKKTTSGSFILTETETSSDAANYTGNNLTGTDNGIQNPGNAYVLGYTPAAGVGFYHLADGGTIGANKAYLTYTAPADGDARQFFSFVDPTGIGETLRYENESQNVYDLQGRRVDQPTKGLYIVNGRKIVIK